MRLPDPGSASTSRVRPDQRYKFAHRAVDATESGSSRTLVNGNNVVPVFLQPRRNAGMFAARVTARLVKQQYRRGAPAVRAGVQVAVDPDTVCRFELDRFCGIRQSSRWYYCQYDGK